MSLATRCPSCGTAFRVVRDQLRVSDGLVRCGRCDAVFDANASLFDLDSALATLVAPPAVDAEEPPGEPAAEASPAAPPPVAAEPSAPPAGVVEPAWDEPAPGEPPPLDVDRLHAVLFRRDAAATGQAGDQVDAAQDLLLPAAAPDVGPLPDAAASAQRSEQVPPADDVAAPEAMAAAPCDAEAPAGEPPAAAAPAEVATPPAADAAEAPAPAPAEPPPATAWTARDDELAAEPMQALPAGDSTLDDAPGTPPRFVRNAERAARWRQPEMRAFLLSAMLLLGATAALLTARGFHQAIAASWPGSQSWLGPLCAMAGCSLEPRRHIDGVSVEGSGLVQIDGGNQMRLSLVLRNRDRGDLLLPAIELTLTDAQGAIVARKVLAGSELGAAATTIAAGAEVTLQAVLDTGEQRVTGYTIELFYP
jgi:predicted Zn finger-like uncharacterized protein